MKRHYILLAVCTLVTASTFALYEPGQTIDTAPMKGRAMIKGKECGYYVTSDKKLLHIDCTDEVITASFITCLPATAMTIPEGYEESFEYTDKHGVQRKCYYKTLSTIPKKNMLSE